MSFDLSDSAPIGADWANIARCASRRSDLACIAGDHNLAAREGESAVSTYHNRYLLWPIR